MTGYDDMGGKQQLGLKKLKNKTLFSRVIEQATYSSLVDTDSVPHSALLQNSKTPTISLTL